jgi:O-antigen ligase
MKEHIVALCYILLIAGLCFALLYKPMTARLMSRDDFARRRNLFIAVTVITFLAHSFWVALFACMLVIGLSARRESNPAALYCALLFAVPQYDVPIPGFGIINQLFEINHPRAMALALLLPVALRLLSSPRTPNPRLRVPDTLLLVYFLYVLVVNATADSITGLMRLSVYFLLDHALLYFVVTRTVTSRQRLFDLLASLTMGLAVIGIVAVFETNRSWLVYESLRAPLGVPEAELTSYLIRETDYGGYLRSYTTAGHAIALGFVCMVVTTFQLALARQYLPRWLGVVVILMPVAGLIASISRGPWLACAIAVALGLSVGTGARRRVAWMAALVPLAAVVLLLHPQGQKFIDLLPFVGAVEPGSVTYRTLLIDRALVVFWQNPILGSLQYIQNPVLEELRQGQGIIDIVNTYLGVALAYGIVGLVLFVAPAVYAVGASWHVSRRLARVDPAAEVAGRALCAAMIAALLAIGAASFYFHIPLLYWLLISLCAAYSAHAPSWRSTAAVSQPQSARVAATSRPTAATTWSRQ